MGNKKNYRVDNTYMIVSGAGENPKLGAKVLLDGRESLFLEFNFGFSWVESKGGKWYKKVDRRRESLSLYLWRVPRNSEERTHNKETLLLAKRIRYERAQRLLESMEGYRLRRRSDDINLIDYMWTYYEGYQKSDVRQIKMAVKLFIDFCNASPRYAVYATRIKPKQLTKEVVMAFVDYLKSRCRGSGALSVYARFKKIIKSAVDAGVLSQSPCEGVSIRIDTNQLCKDVLSQEEVKQLIATRYEGENFVVRRAFIFSLYSGLRWCDVRDLTFASVDYSNRLLRFEQNKTKGHSSASGVVIPLNDGLLKLIGQPPMQRDIDGKCRPIRGALVFPLPSDTTCLRILQAWVSKANIDKHITWHCARHSFAVNILNNGANIKTVASLLGHSTLKHTEKYTRAVDRLKEEAINSLPTLEF